MPYVKRNESGVVIAQFANLQPDYAEEWVDDVLDAYVEEESKQQKLEKITVTTQSGKTFDGNETARGDMMAALAAGELLGETETYWKMANNDKVLVTRDELLEALSLAIQEKGRIVGAIE